MIQPTSAPIRATTQEFLEIEDIVDDIVIMTNGSAALVIETTAVNFGLLSEEEQDALIYAYASFLNSLSFPLQVVILSKRMDISSYIEFILSSIKENRVLEKKFYLVVPFSQLELGIKEAFSVSNKKKKLPFTKDYILSRAKTS